MVFDFLKDLDIAFLLVVILALFCVPDLKKMKIISKLVEKVYGKAKDVDSEVKLRDGSPPSSPSGRSSVSGKSPADDIATPLSGVPSPKEQIAKTNCEKEKATATQITKQSSKKKSKKGKKKKNFLKNHIISQCGIKRKLNDTIEHTTNPNPNHNHQTSVAGK